MKIKVILTTLDERTYVNAEVHTVEPTPQLLMKFRFDFCYEAGEGLDYMHHIEMEPNFTPDVLPFWTQVEILRAVSFFLEDALEDESTPTVGEFDLPNVECFA